MEGRAILFDLDDTLYSERRFILSGFAAVAHAIAERDGMPASETYRALVGALRAGRRSSAFQDLCEAHGLDRTRIAEWVSLVRAHAPRLRIARRTRAMLDSLRKTWRVGLVSNGLPDVQGRKIDGLALCASFDHICLPGLPGQGGKPAPEPFAATCAALGVAPWRTVHVGNDPETDVKGARGAGLKTILVTRHTAPVPTCAADRIVGSIFDVPQAAEALIHDA